MRLPFVFFVVASVAACGLESAGQMAGDGGPIPDDAATVDVAIDRGNGVTEAGVKCGCVPALPTGWSWVAYQRDGSSPCGGAFAASSPRVAIEATGAPATCGCTCGLGTGATCTVTASVNLWQNGACLTNPDGNFTSNGNACYDNADYDRGGVGIGVKATATPTITGATCGAGNASKNVPAAEVHTGGVCPFVGALGSGCSGTDACVPDPPAGFSVCVVSETPNAACPVGYGVKRSVGAAFADTRDCGPACTCTPAPTCTATGQFHTDPGCGATKKDGLPFAMDGTCKGIALTGITAHSMSTTTTVTQTCNPSAYKPTGEVGVSGGYTICCP